MNTNPEQINNTEYQAKVVPEKAVASTNPLDNSSNGDKDYHNVEEIASDMGVEVDDNEELSMVDRLKARDDAR